ncbi:hypothetical protein [Sulfurimonas sp.]
MTQTYKYAIVYFLAFSLLLLLSSVMLFDEKIGFSIDEITKYYLGDKESFVIAKTFAGVLKMILAHLFVFGLFSMVLLHFLIFTKYRDTRGMKILIYLLFMSAFLELFSPFMIILGVDFFAYIKLFSFVLFEGLVLYIGWLLFYSIVYN